MSEKLSILAIDYGSKHVGLALWKGDWIAARPLASYSRGGNVALKQILSITNSESVKSIVIGLPLSAEGKETTLSMEARKFGERLKKRVNEGVTLHFEDEYDSSSEARERLASYANEVSVHSVAAVVILERYVSNLI